MIGGAVPPLDAVFAPFSEAAIVTIPGETSAVTVWCEQSPVGNRFGGEGGTWSYTTMRRRGSLKLADLPACPQPGLSWPPPQTKIELAAETFYVEGVDEQDEERVHVIVR